MYNLWYVVYFFKATATTEIYTLSLHDALPILAVMRLGPAYSDRVCTAAASGLPPGRFADQLSCAMAVILPRSEEHTSELQSQSNLVCRLLLEKKKHHLILMHPVTDLSHQHN